MQNPHQDQPVVLNPQPHVPVNEKVRHEARATKEKVLQKGYEYKASANQKLAAHRDDAEDFNVHAGERDEIRAKQHEVNYHAELDQARANQNPNQPTGAMLRAKMKGDKLVRKLTDGMLTVAQKIQSKMPGHRKHRHSEENSPKP